MKYLTAMLSKSYKIVETIKYVKPLIFKGFFDVWIYLHPSESPLIYPKNGF